MRRILAVAFVWLGSALFAGAIPARVPRVPEPPKAPVLSVLAGTVWSGTLFLANSRIAFFPDGTLTYGESGQTSPGTWRLEGNRLRFDINQYSEYDTVLVGDLIQGEGWNKAGQRCTPRLHRVGVTP